MILSCPFCNAKVAPTQQTCPSCAKRMTRRCPACAEDIAVDMKTCKYCGEDVTAPSAARTPGIEFIEETPKSPKKRKCGLIGKLLVTSALLFGMGMAAVGIRMDCVACSKASGHSQNISVSLCNRKICKNGKTPLWATVVEKLGGKVCSKQRASCCEGDISRPVKGSDWQ